MASLTKHPQSRYFTACYTNHEGKQVKRSTKQTDRSEALRIALEWEALEKKSRQGTLTTVQIHKVLNDLSERATGDNIHLPSVETFFSNWLDGKESRGAAAGTIVRYRNTVKKFLASLGDKARMPINGIAPVHIENFLTARIKNGAAPKTVIVDIKGLSTAFNYAESMTWILKNPVKAIVLPKNVSSEREIFTHEQVGQIVDGVGSFLKEKGMTFVYNWRTLILLGYYTGARLSDCANMKFKNLDFKRNIIFYSQQKTGKDVLIPIHIELFTHINELINMRDEPLPELAENFLCGDLAGKSTGGKHGLSQTFLRILKSAGIESKNIQGKGKQKFNCLSFHSLRHSFNTNLFNNDVSQEVRMKLTGHSSVAMNTRYTHPDLTSVTKAIQSLRSLSPEDN